MPQIIILIMGGTKKKPLGSEKSARASGSEGENLVKKEETKPSGKLQQKQKLSVLVAITIQGVARAVGVKISVANPYIRSLETKGIVKSVG